LAEALRVKRTIGSGMGLILLVAGAACSSVDDQRAGNESRTSELKVVVSNEPVTMNPVLAGVTDGRVWTSMMEPLIRSDESGALLDSGLTTSWEQVTPTTWEFPLRHDV
jgi:ABC-type transport system substrate-binding protein